MEFDRIKVAHGEIYEFALYKTNKNSWTADTKPLCTFKGRPAQPIEKKKYRISQGFESASDGTYIIATNLPENIKPRDKVWWLGKMWDVASVGYYFDETRMVNAGIFADDFILESCPKGITLQ